MTAFSSTVNDSLGFVGMKPEIVIVQFCRLSVEHHAIMMRRNYLSTHSSPYSAIPL